MNGRVIHVSLEDVQRSAVLRRLLEDHGSEELVRMPLPDSVEELNFFEWLRGGTDRQYRRVVPIGHTAAYVLNILKVRSHGNAPACTCSQPGLARSLARLLSELVSARQPAC